MKPTRINLYTTPSNTFYGPVTSFEKADYAILGVPFDRTSSFRGGSRFAPNAIRQASLNIETMSVRSNIDLEEVKITDLGDLAETANAEELIHRVRAIVEDILKLAKLPILIGGEHTLTLGTIQSLPKDACVICFDAHLDLRDEYLGERVCHASFMRRVIELIGSENVLYVGTRAISNDEYEFARENRMFYIRSHELNHRKMETCINKITEETMHFKKKYITIDMDVLDPAFAPGVGNPEADGISTTILLDILSKICDSTVLGLDLVEANPLFDHGQTSIAAARILFEGIAAIESSKLKLKKKS
ncbi:agmatinase [[Eubacterium] cellulosolvens]